MTSVIAWISADKRRPTGLYFATDSRRTVELPDKTVHFYDNFVKAFASESTNEIFAFAGDATFPPAALDKVCAMLEGNAPTVNRMEPIVRSSMVFRSLQDDFNALNIKPTYAFCILHGTRSGANFKAKFHLFKYSYRIGGNYLERETLNIKEGYSIALEVLGTGTNTVETTITTETKLLGNVSRVQFSAFCAAVQGNAVKPDKFSGGPIQLVGILSICNAVHMGVVTPSGTYFRGGTKLPPFPENIYWRNTQFKNVDVKGEPRKGACKASGVGKCLKDE